ncbi:uncharacterized protein YndB with AHSA1/START domain [Prauserella shujinwangii]|uniref:Uncharacterized protein YndB with AHSA1/START domain n=1 Tax=Prauserella shujinwangii TaxID=1453103 RepID=A0A2T0LZC9_9PSEU|nr:SRPBCC family protein [Prauserella shujinwangii]PRX49459.1 uncharacterized protein YndB with AHSA1/START domain [Prauserella shujinwangii]
MTDHKATLQTIAGNPVLRFERRLAHPPEKVWRAITEPGELAHWFPSTVELSPEVGAAMRFTFESEGDGGTGEVLEFDPPKVFAFRWNHDVLRFEIVPDDGGCLLLFSHTLGGGRLGELGAGRNAAGWDTCLAALLAHLGGQRAEEPEMLPRMEFYAAEFGLAEGEVRTTGDGFELHFARDLVWRPAEQVWAMLTGEEDPAVGDPPPAGCTVEDVENVSAGQLTAVQAPRLLEFTWLHEGGPAGRVRWELVQDPEFGTRVELTQTVPARLAGLRPAALAAWQARLEQLYAAVLGEERERSRARVAELRERYEHRLA